MSAEGWTPAGFILPETPQALLAVQRLEARRGQGAGQLCAWMRGLGMLGVGACHAQGSYRGISSFGLAKGAASGILAMKMGALLVTYGHFPCTQFPFGRL